MSPTPVTFTSPVLPTAYAWEATNEQVAERYGVPIDSIVRFDLNTSPTPPALVDRLLAAGQFDTPLSEYPPSDYRRLTEAAAARYGVGTDELLVGAGADEILDLVAKAFLAEGSRAVLPAPTYAMYRVLTEQRGAEVVTVPRRPPAEGWALDVDAVRAAARGSSVVWLCSPNNPTGLAEPDGTIELLLTALATDAEADETEPPIVVLDEAYAEFVGTTLLPLREAYPRLIVVRTASKAYALAGLRVGFAIAQPRGHRPHEPVPPAWVGVHGLGDDRDRGAARPGDPGDQPRPCGDRARPPRRRADRCRLVGRAERDELPAGRLRLPGTCRRHGRGTPRPRHRPAHVRHGPRARLLPAPHGSRPPRERPAHRGRPPAQLGDPRMTTPLGTLDVTDRGTRRVSVSRRTRETEIDVSLDLDGSGVARISTGVGFYDHLLTSLAHHGLFDVEIRATGDLEVDEHHTVEDVALVLGSAFAEALGDRAGIRRFGEASVPMDESLATAVIDVGGRPYAVIDLPFRGERVGGLPLQLVEHALEAFARTAGATLHVRGTGRNDHHLAEAAFKALARALREACESDPRRDGVASTKGSLG